MSAEVLREAAALMRERAEAASPAPWSGGRFFWKVGSTRVRDEWWASVETRRGDVVASMPEEAAPSRPNAEHIASWHPTVALAVADLLDSTSSFVEMYGEQGADARGYSYLRSLAVATAYLGESL